MERPQNIKKSIFIVVVILFHVVGAIGLCVPKSRPYFLHMVPYHLLLMAIVLGFAHRGFDKKFVFFALLVFIVGYIAEWVGVHTALLFGHYSYGNTLGPKFNGVPVIIGINWFLLIYCVGAFTKRRRIKSHLLRILLGALILTLLDVLIEPSAIKFYYWHWDDNNIIPLTNYLTWFILSAVLLFVFDRLKFSRQSIVAETFLVIQFLFFASLVAFAR